MQFPDQHHKAGASLLKGTAPPDHHSRPHSAWCFQCFREMSWDDRAVRGVLGFLSLSLDFRISPPGSSPFETRLVFSALPEQKPELNVHQGHGGV